MRMRVAVSLERPVQVQVQEALRWKRAVREMIAAMAYGTASVIARSGMAIAVTNDRAWRPEDSIPD